MQAGRLRDRVTILNVTTARSPSGHPVETVTEELPYGQKLRGSAGGRESQAEQKPLRLRSESG